MANFCESCGNAVKGNFNKCFRCQLAARYQEGYDLGFSQGFIKGEDAKNAPKEPPKLALTEKRWRQLVQLCHPDKHGGSQTAVEIQAWLNEVKPG